MRFAWRAVWASSVVAGCGLTLGDSAPLDAGALLDAGAATQVDAPPSSLDGALVPPADFLVGSGKDGAFAATGDGIPSFQHYTELEQDAADGATVLNVKSAAGFSKGDLVLAMHTADPQKSDVAPGADVNLDDGSLGTFMLLEVMETPAPSAQTLDVRTKDGSGITAPIPRNGTQLVRVPQFTSFDVPANSSIRAKPWDGSTGGILAFMVRGMANVDGKVLASGVGFRGGAHDENTVGSPCEGNDGPATHPSAPKGEGPFTAYFNGAKEVRGLNPFGSGGGGGRCLDAGGGGGGHVGKGGSGGKVSGTTGGQGGLGGAKVVYRTAAHLNPHYGKMTFGGGGGSGDTSSNAVDPAKLAGTGGRGGGVVFVRAMEVRGVGVWEANGDPGSSAMRAGANDGGGGGGAGGWIDLRAQTSLSCGKIQVKGGAGAPAALNHGPGGGGSGGRVILPPTTSCPVENAGGQNGVAGSENHGAGPGDGGDTVTVGKLP